MRFRLLSAFGPALFACLWSAQARAEEPASSVPPGSVQLEPPAHPAADLPPPGARATHIVVGASITAVSYGLALGTSYLFPEEDWRGSKKLRIPVAGPWMTLAQTGCPTSDPDCSVVPLVLGAIFAVIDGVSQVGGLAIIGEGLFLNTSSGTRPAPKKAAGLTLRPVPMDFGPGSAGFGFAGSF